MAISLGGFSGGGGGAGSDTLDDVTGRGATTTNAVTVGGLSIGSAYSMPTADGGSGQALVSDGAGNLSFTTIDPTGALEYKGSFNANTGAPSLVNAKQGDYYKISTEGTIYGQTWAVNDSLLINADMGGSITNSKIDKIDNTEPTNVLITTNNLNDLENVATAKTNLGLETVASTGAYSDLSGTPTLGTAAAANTGTGIGQVVIMEDVGSVAKLPALDGSQLINLPSVSPFTTTSTISANYDASVNEIINLQANTGGEIRVNLPSSASDGDIIILRKPSNTSSADPAGQGTRISVYNSSGTKLKDLEIYPVLGSHILSYDGSDWTFPVTNLKYQNYTSNTYTLYGYRFGKEILYANSADTSDFTINIQVGASSLLEGARQRVIARSNRSITITSTSTDIVTPTSGGATVVLANTITVPAHSGMIEIWVNSQSQYMISAPLANLGTSAFLNTGTGIGQVVIMEDVGSVAKLPAVNGSQLTGITATDSTKLAITQNLNDLENVATAKTNLGLETVASTGAYSDLSGTPTLGTAAASATTDFLSATGADSLGGNIDVNGHDIISSSNGDIEIAPDGNGSFIIKGNATSGSGRVVLNCEQNSHGITLKGPAHSFAATYQLVFPTSVGTNGQVLKTDGGDSGSPNSVQLAWVDQASGGGGYTYSAITSTTTAQLDYHYSCGASDETFTLNLPAVASGDAGKEIRVKNMGTGTITIDGNSSSTIDGQTTITLDVQFSSVTLVATGNASASWEII